MKRSKWMFITKRYSHLLVILAFFDFGCAHTHQISQQSPVNFGSKKVRIVLMNSSERIAAHHDQVASDSVSYINTKTKMAADTIAWCRSAAVKTARFSCT